MTEALLDNIKVILVATTHPGNIGATARAMKTMGLSRLELVTPKIFPAADASARASGADDILASARIHDSLAEAVGDCHLVFGTSTRRRSIPWPLYTPAEAAGRAAGVQAKKRNIAVVFGRESSGLANRELELCNAMIRIPADPQFSSLNIASAVQIIAYEFRVKLLAGIEDAKDNESDDIAAASHAQIQQLFEQLERCLVELNYLDPQTPRLLMRRLKRIINRSELDIEEYNIARGIIEAARQAASKNKRSPD